MIGWITKKAGRLAWRMLRPVRQPLRTRFDAHVSRLLAETVNARLLPPVADALGRTEDRLGRIERSLGLANQAASDIAEEMDLVLGGLSREVFRLQAQVEEIRSLIAADPVEIGASGSFHVVDPSGDDEPVRRSLGADRAAWVG